MELGFYLIKEKSSIKTLIADILILMFIYFIPAISHLLSFPIYYLDPMRIALVFAIITTNKRNTFLIALTLPIFSFLISSHPTILKSFLLSGELLLNISLFYLLKEKINNLFFSFLLSTTFSKLAYYTAKFVLINNGLMDQKLFSTPVEFQLLSMIVLGVVIYWFGNKTNLEKD